ncbi:MAG TPA: hypothetical protein VFC46_12630, partial [Humisphaera sp.]|nr:hypothetical protein [Humisphaera sp.]
MPKILLWSLIVLVAFSNVFSPLVANAGETDSSLRDIADIFIRDPFILTDAQNGRYILVAKIHRKDVLGWECFTSK